MSDQNGNPFNIIGSSDAPVQKSGGAEVKANQSQLTLKERIEAIINSSETFLFMKGSPQMPQCGFSANTTSILNSLGVSYKTFDILSDMDIREGVKQYANWPTYPQLYHKGQLLGGNDIVVEMYHSGELQQILKS